MLYYLFISSLIWNTYAATIRTNTVQEYQNQSIHCTANEACNVLCLHADSCQEAQIYCPTDYPCKVLCQQDTACANAIIHAEYTSSFELLDCATGSFTCRGISIYFPPNDAGIPKASIIGADTGLSAGANLTQPLQFYAIYGWNDINVTTSSAFTYRYHAGTMHCTQDFQATCDFNTDEWHCANADDLCNDPLHSLLVTTQTETEERQFYATPHSLETTPSNIYYALVAILVGFVCFFGCILLFYTYYSDQHNTKIASDSQYSINGVPSTTNSTVGSPPSIPSIASTPQNSKPIKISINGEKNQSSIPPTETMVWNTTYRSPKPVTTAGARPRYFNYPMSNHVSIPHMNQQHMQLQPPIPPVQLMGMQHQLSTASSLPSIPPSFSYGHERILHPPGAPPQHTLVPSASLHTSMSSGNEHQIMYQQPSQQQMMHMLSMMNHSNPHSLSSFMKNNGNSHYIMNQQPIEPSAASSCDSACAQPRRATLTSERRDDHLVVPPAVSVLSTFTSVSSGNADAPLSEDSQHDTDETDSLSTSDSNLNTLNDAIYVE